MIERLAAVLGPPGPPRGRAAPVGGPRAARGGGEALLAWLALIGVLVTLAGIVVSRTTAVMHSPVTAETMTSVPASPRGQVNLFDERTAAQVLRARVREVTGVGMGVTNFRRAPPEALLRLTLETEDGETIAASSLPVAAIEPNDLTEFPLRAALTPGGKYRVRLGSTGISREQALTVWHESKPPKVPTGEATVESAAGRHASSGNLRVQLLRNFSGAFLWRELSARPSLRLLVVLVAIVLLLPLCGPVRRWSARLLPRPLDLYRPPIRWFELLATGVVGLVAAFLVTAPLYATRGAIPAWGDPNRALVYSGLARETLLKDRELARWDPYLCGGVPFVGNPEANHLEPFFLLVLAFGEDLGSRLSVTVAVALAFSGAAVLARRLLALPFPAALVAGAVFALSGAVLFPLSAGIFNWFVLGWIPWLLLCFVEALHRTGWVLAGAALLAALFLGGSVHMPLYALIAAGVLAISLAGFFRSARPLLVFALLVSLALPLTAIKLLPVAETHVFFGDYRRPPGVNPPETLALKMFTARDQRGSPPWVQTTVNGRPAQYTEHHTYIGWLPLVLAAAGAAFALGDRRGRALLATASLLFLFTFGTFPIPLLQRVPLLGELLRNPQRIRLVLVLALALLAARGLTALTARLPARRATVAALGILAVVLADLITFHQPQFKKLLPLAPPSLPTATTFTRFRDSFTDLSRGFYRTGYVNFLAHQGTTDLCHTYLQTRGVYARGVDSSNPLAPYQGEAFLGNGGTASLVRLSANRMVVSVAPTRAGPLVLNQNAFPGWQSSPPRLLRAYQGRLAVSLHPDDRELTLTYWPFSFTLGTAITMSALILAGGGTALWWVRRRLA